MIKHNEAGLNSQTAKMVLQLIARALGCGKTVRKKYVRYDGSEIPKDYLSKKKNGKKIFTPLTKTTLGAIMYIALDINDFDRKSNIKLGSLFIDNKSSNGSPKPKDTPYEKMITAKHLVIRCKYVLNLLKVLQYICNLPKRYRSPEKIQKCNKKRQNIGSFKLKPFQFRNLKHAQVLDYMIYNQSLSLQYWQYIIEKPKSDESKIAVKSYIDVANKGQLSDVYADDYYCRLFLYTFFMNYFKMINNKFDFSKEARELFVKMISTQPFYDKIYIKINDSAWEQVQNICKSNITEYYELIEDKETCYVRQYHATNKDILHFQLSSSASQKSENEFLSSLCEFVGSVINKNSIEDIENIIECSFNSQIPYLKNLKDVANIGYIGKLFWTFLITEGIISLKYDKDKVSSNLVKKFNKFYSNMNKAAEEYMKKTSNSGFESWKI